MPRELMRTMISVQAIPDTSAIRTAELFDVEHTIIPCIALVEGVLWPANAPHPELALAEEFGRFPQGWDGRPVVLNHPRLEGVPVPANSPGVLEDNSFGQIFNTELTADGKLRTEIWINNARVKELPQEFQDTVDRLIDGNEAVEVSTGLFTMQEVLAGEFNGEEYGSVWRNIVPDHLAILPEGIKGACSVEDGCGAPRVNANSYAHPKDVPTQFVPTMRAAQLSNQACSCKDVGVIEASTLMADGTSTIDEESSLFKRLLTSITSALSLKTELTGASENVSDSDQRMAITAALNASEANTYFYILAVFDSGDDSGRVVYERNFGELLEQGFSIDASGSGTISLSGNAIQVRPVTQFVPVTVASNTGGDSDTDPTENSVTSNSGDTIDTQLQESAMNKDELIASLIANSASSFAESDKDWLNTLSEEHIQKLIPLEVDPAAGATTTVIGGGGDDTDVSELSAATPPATTEEYIAGAPPEVQSVLNQGLTMHRDRKNALIKGLLANDRCKFTDAQLQTRDIDELENLAILSNDVTFDIAGASGEAGLRDQSDSNITPAPSIWGDDKAAA